DYIDLGPLKLSSNYVRIARMIHAEDSIDKYTGPVLIVHGDEDEAVPLDYSWKAAYRYKNCKLVVIPGDDHCYTRHLDQVCEAIREFVRQLN
ncbi:MAG: alpha/beta hydrolase, partial [Erysipelotrichaceae bacterium]|nr:alpha/beta hydrolase [Erysipelotrichaceae bacterium]